MLKMDVSELIWLRGRTDPVSGILYDDNGDFMDLNGKTVDILIEQNGVGVSKSASYTQDILVASRACPDPTETYPNDDLYFGDAGFTFSNYLQPGNYIYLQEDGAARIHVRRIHFVNANYLTLFTELPEGVDSGWNWWATTDNPNNAQLGMFQFDPGMGAMILGPFTLMAKVTDEDSKIHYSWELSGYVKDPISVT